MISEGVRYGVRTRQNSSFDFQLQHLNFIAAFKSFHSSFRIHIIGKRFYGDADRKKGVGRQHPTSTSGQNAACSFET